MSTGKFESPGTRASAQEPGTDPVALPAEQAERLAAELDWSDPNSILFFGARVQRELAAISDRMLRLAVADSVGEAGAELDRMLNLIREFRPEAPSPRNWWQRILRRSRVDPLVRRVSNLLNRMDLTAASLERSKTRLLTDAVTLKRLAERARAEFQRLAQYEQVGRRMLARAPEAVRGELLARCEDLALSRQVAQQSLAAMAVSRQATRDLLARLNSVLDHTFVLWKQHMAQVVAIWRGRQTAAALAELASGGAELQRLGADLAAARERLAQRLAAGQVDLDAVVTANRELERQLEAGSGAARQAREAARQAGNLLVTGR